MPSIVGKDDLSNINPNPPSVQFNIRHTLTQVSLYEFDQSAASWNLICSVPPPANPDPPIGTTVLSGVWLTGDPQKANPRQVMTQLKVLPWRLLPGQDWTALWSAQSTPRINGTALPTGVAVFLCQFTGQHGGISYAGVVQADF